MTVHAGAYVRKGVTPGRVSLKREQYQSLMLQKLLCSWQTNQEDQPSLAHAHVGPLHLELRTKARTKTLLCAVFYRK